MFRWMHELCMLYRPNGRPAGHRRQSISACCFPSSEYAFQLKACSFGPFLSWACNAEPDQGSAYSGAIEPPDLLVDIDSACWRARLHHKWRLPLTVNVTEVCTLNLTTGCNTPSCKKDDVQRGTSMGVPSGKQTEDMCEIVTLTALMVSLDTFSASA